LREFVAGLATNCVAIQFGVEQTPKFDLLSNRYFADCNNQLLES
jgi:hypothetical protein